MDYLSMLEQLDIPLNDNNVIMPKDLEQAHDNVVSLIEQLESEERIKQVEQDKSIYQERLKQLSKLETEIDEFVFLVPKELQEIIQEGSKLHHCVGNQHYLEEHLKGDTNIVFVRRKDDTSKPFFTLEYKNKKVVQIQGKYNREDVPSPLKVAVDKWQTEIKNVV